MATHPQLQANAPATASRGPRLTIAQAEQMAIRNNPNISVARLLALAQAQLRAKCVRQNFRLAIADLTAVGAHDNSRITAGSLNNPTVFDRAAGGLTVSQLITDFGRTHNLVLSAVQREGAAGKLARHGARYYFDRGSSLLSGAHRTGLLKVAQETLTSAKPPAIRSAPSPSNIRSTSTSVLPMSRSRRRNCCCSMRKTRKQRWTPERLSAPRDQQYTSPTRQRQSPRRSQRSRSPREGRFNARPDLAALNDSFTAAASSHGGA